MTTPPDPNSNASQSDATPVPESKRELDVLSIPVQGSNMAVERETRPPSRVHLAIALVAGLALIAFPLFLWVRPSLHSKIASSTSPSDPPESSEALPTGSAEQAQDEFEDSSEEKPSKSDLVSLGKVWIDKCEKPGPDKTPPEQCDRQPFFEQALARAIMENTACAPERSSEGTVSVVLRADYRRRKLDVFAGKSGSIRGRSAQGLIKCIERSIPEPDWDSLDHEHTKYIIAVMATYPGR